MTQAGGKLPLHLVEKFGDFAQKNSFPFFIMYGQTEATARMSYLPPEFLLETPESIGIPIPNGKFTIDKETNELLYSGPNVFGGYAESADDLRFFEQPEFLSTGDLAEERDGFFYITGRIKRMVKLFGQRVNLDETENILVKSFKESAFACAAKDDKKMFVFYNNQGVEPDSIVKILKEILLLHHSAFKVIFVLEFPLTANGKINYHKLIEQYGTE
jgi:acyl-CoA synthetase (AMP-forming)/AMP-acid ligase II